MGLDSYRTLGRTGLRVSPLTLGAMTFGDASWGADTETSHRIIDRYRERGGNFLDSANGYNAGKSEETLGSYLAQHPGVRDRLVLATKFGGNMYPGDPNGGGAGRKAIMQQVEESLRRLGTDYIDLYWQHNFDRHTPIEETMATLNDLVRAGKIRYIGLSDTHAWEVARAGTIAEFRGWAPVAAIQVEYSLLQRTVEGELFGVAREFGIGVTPWSPLASGVLSGKYSRSNSAPEGSGRAQWAAAHLTEKTFTLLDVLQRIADDLNASVAAVALAWVRSRAEVTSTIIGVRTVKQLDDNLASLDVTIPDEQLAELAELTAPQLDFPAAFVTETAVPWQQGGTTINGVSSEPYSRG
ncbi:Predicted oxidoreductase [Streptomyces sp. DvalAA-14]|uniref:aldo/keto reductase n=1 Tax=unclassified Streptomyces TaxID=2593676 RepID=UPI00081B4C52|nr:MULTISPECIES: aldo/keto reductase [unclassified Streptomyces]MYS23835.1 aldo/keto reductase [Streptomyces sp. SID4948]SCE39215.1 Predicted oxidoreductase [Streptomyces sp. DvalAA-14]